MKTKMILGLIALLIMFKANAQETTSEIKIKTSATCDMCKETIEKYVTFEKGVKKITVDVESKIATVVYNSKKTSPEKIKIAISNSGYDADEVHANAKAYEKLDDCCKRGKICNDKK